MINRSSFNWCTMTTHRTSWLHFWTTKTTLVHLGGKQVCNQKKAKHGKHVSEAHKWPNTGKWKCAVNFAQTKSLNWSEHNVTRHLPKMWNNFRHYSGSRYVGQSNFRYVGQSNFHLPWDLVNIMKWNQLCDHFILFIFGLWVLFLVS